MGQGQCILLKRVFVLLFSTVFIVECGAYDTTLEASHLSISPMHSVAGSIPAAMAHPPLSPYLSSKPLHSFAIKVNHGSVYSKILICFRVKYISAVSASVNGS
jgi:hypothetical protein